MAVASPSDRSELLERVTVAAANHADHVPPPGVVERYLDGVPLDDLTELGPDHLAAVVATHWDDAQRRAPGEVIVRVDGTDATPGTVATGRTWIQIVTDDMPFLVDSVTAELDRVDLSVLLLVHPILDVCRDEENRAVSLGGDRARAESFIHIEIPRLGATAQASELAAALQRVLHDVVRVVHDWQPMLARANAVAAEIGSGHAAVDRDTAAEARALLEWMADDHFTFVGYRQYVLRRGDDGADRLERVAGSGLGILRTGDEDGGPANTFDRLSPRAQALARDPSLLVMTKANSRSTVHRSAYLDYVGVKRFDEHGEVCGEDRFLGLYTSSAYYESPFEIPLLRRKAAAVVERAGFDPLSHSGKDIQDIIETYPRDELFQIEVDDLYDNAMAILALTERRRVRLLVRRDPYGRFVTCLLFVPRDRYTTALRLSITDLLMRAFRATGSEYQTRVTEARLARLHFVLHVPPDAPEHIDVAGLERAIAAATRTWSEELRDRLVERRGEEVGTALHDKYATAFTAAYQDDFAPPGAIADIELIEALDGSDAVSVRMRSSIAGNAELTIVKTGSALALSDVMPVLHNFGVRVLAEHPYEVEAVGSGTVWLEQFTLDAHPGGGDLEQRHLRFEEALAATLRGENENDAFNGLVLGAGLRWSDVTVLRAYCRYLRQIASRYSQEYLARALIANAPISAQLAELFRVRFDPARQAIAAEETARINEAIVAALDAVSSLDDDRILRSLLASILATVRTNAFTGAARSGDRTLAFKIDPTRVPDVPKPVPHFEIFVASPRVEGVHLRMGPVARGGIRWSDRPEDFRTEILGLVKAQSVKNAVIVPTGAKGGFVVKRPPSGASRDELAAEVVHCYRAFIGALLDVTDNLAGSRVIPPPSVVRYDPDDPYLVVAADKGTAAFSDVANEIATTRGFWLGDAFASGGSAGYDHKAMGITARGAWESVRHHFRQLALDVQASDFTVVGIGDMSGDVFGNGMLLSRHIRLVAAFDHRHVFLDPDPDAASAYEERARLFGLPRSSWDDYDRTKLSPGGGIHPRTAKSIPLSTEVRRRLGIEALELTPAELISAILRAPVDLLWNGGIGTYVKATLETHADVGDKTNDGIRIDASQVRAKVIGEGGNLGLTQLARVELALRGVFVNSDAIDNSAGVDCSDHEVNIKILLDGVVRDGELAPDARNTLLEAMTDEVASLVLRDNYVQNRALANARAQAPAMIDVHQRYLRLLEHSGEMDRALEFLPDDETLARRHQSGHGLTTPELAVVMAYTKNGLAHALRDAEIGTEGDFASELSHYFPTPLRDRYAEQIARHPLAGEIVATTLANSVVNYAGTSFAFRIGEETGATVPDLVRAHFVAWHAFDQGSLWRAVEALDGLVAADVQTEMYLESRKLVERAARWILRHRARPLRVRTTLDALRPAISDCLAVLPSMLLGSEARWLRSATAELMAAGVAEDIATRVGSLDSAFAALDITEVAAQSGHSIADVARVHTLLGDRLRLDWLRDRVIEDLPRDDRWHSLARNALRDDTHAEHRAIVEHCLASSPDGVAPEALVERWLEAHASDVARLHAMLDDVSTRGIFDFGTLQVALREVRNLIG